MRGTDLCLSSRICVKQTGAELKCRARTTAVFNRTVSVCSSVMTSRVTDKAVGSWNSPSRSCAERAGWHWLIPQIPFLCNLEACEETSFCLVSFSAQVILSGSHSQWIYMGRHTSQEPIASSWQSETQLHTISFRTSQSFITVSESLVLSYICMCMWCVCLETDIFHNNSSPSLTWTQSSKIWLLSYSACSRDPVSTSWLLTGGFDTFKWVLGIWTQPSPDGFHKITK